MTIVHGGSYECVSWGTESKRITFVKGFRSTGVDIQR